MTERTSTPAREDGPQFRPRPGPFRLMLVLQGVFLLGMLTGLAVLLVSSPLSRLADRVMDLFPWWFLVQALFFGAYAHAYWGALGTLGKAPAPIQLWRHPELRTLPALPPLPLRTAVLLYAVPLALMGSMFAWAMQDVTRQGRQSAARYAVLSQWTSAKILGFTRVSCRDFPAGRVQPDSLCLVAWQDFPQGRSFADTVRAWVQVERLTFTDAGQPVELDLPFRQAGGVTGGQWTVPLRRITEDDTQPFTVTAVSRRDPAPASGAAPAPELASWLRGQAFHSVLIVTPGASSPGVTAP
ncbi:hypothetical protein [Deinococcus sp. JMULE3]|uniref:hypothetical protein n=1 Tax=Deinococcus sp. JMULE3 TaxID=2518341 RepID=UPI0015775EE3|nr:hypothetical protein [Deinococcus sp. JMULE3]NTY01132.1 hypothetical protein [Deinococcus sp. JMULE3]